MIEEITSMILWFLIVIVMIFYLGEKSAELILITSTGSSILFYMIFKGLREEDKTAQDITG